MPRTPARFPHAGNLRLPWLTLIRHWQLRSLIDSERENTLYFPGGARNNHILRLDTTSRCLEPVRLLSFSPRCLVAKNGWVCCGGETGEFAAVRLEPRHNPDGMDVQLDLDPDSRLPLDLDSTDDTAATLRAMSRALDGSGSKATLAKSMKLVRDRVNCITLWFPPEDMPSWPGVYPESIAVLANNDKTVALVSLDDFDDNEKIDPVCTITYPDFVNRAVISPNGRLLVAVLDDPYLYVHERVEVPGPDEGGSLFGPQYRWEGRDRHLLKSQSRDDRSQNRGSFALCFSNSGAYLAVGTQYGTISIFDTSALTDPTKDPLITTFQSSRPDTVHGAVRDMAFCPGPYDLLAWTEDRGRVGIADVRTGFTHRQILDIGNRDGFQEVSVSDESAIDPWLLLAARRERDQASPPTLSNSLLMSADRRRGGAASRHRHEPSLSPNETRILEAVQDGAEASRWRAWRQVRARPRVVVVGGGDQ
jgi:hypothetical protein